MQTRPLCAPVLRSWAKHGMRLVPWPEAGRTVPWAGPYGKLYFALVFVQGMSLGQVKGSHVCRNYDISNWAFKECLQKWYQFRGSPSRNVVISNWAFSGMFAGLHDCNILLNKVIIEKKILYEACWQVLLRWKVELTLFCSSITFN